MVYVGKKLPAVRGYGVDPALIDPSLKVAWRRPDHAGVEMGYWPSYSEISPACRAAYLEWLLAGRRKHGTYIGYVFLFFYGIERRLLIDLVDDPSSEEARALRQEVRELLNVYGGNNSFRGYAEGLLSFLEIRTPSKLADGPPPGIEQRGWDFPASVELAIAAFARDGRPVPADWAFSWYITAPDARLRTPHRRCEEELKQLFAIRYAERYSDGLVVKPSKKPLESGYHPASAGFNGHVTASDSHLTQAARLKRPLNQIGKIVEDAAVELEPYSRWLGRNPDGRGTIEALAVLPPALVDSDTNEALATLRATAGLLLDGEKMRPVAFHELTRAFSEFVEPPANKRSFTAFATLLDRAGVGIEPDPRAGGRLPELGAPVIVFEAGEGGAPPTNSDEFEASALEIRLAMLVAAADGTIEQSELAEIRERVDGTLGLTRAERIRLHARAEWLSRTPPSRAGLRAALARISNAQAQALSRMLVRVALANGRLSAAEIKSLERLFVEIGLEASHVHDVLHEHESIDESTGRPPGHASESVETSDAATVLDHALVERRMHESAEVARLLEDIFEDEEAVGPDLAGATPPATMTPLEELLEAVLVRMTWTREEFEQLAAKAGLPPDGAIERLDDLAFDRIGDSLFDNDDPIELNPYTAEQLASE